MQRVFEVREHQLPALVDQNVLGLEVLVDESIQMQLRQPDDDLGEVLLGRLRGELDLAAEQEVEQVAQVAPLLELALDVQDLRVTRSLLFHPRRRGCS